MNSIYYTLTNEELEGEANKVKALIISYLYNNDHITTEVHDNIQLNYGIIIKKPSFFSRWWKTKKVKDVDQYMIVKQLSIVEVDEKEKDPKSILNVVKFDNNKEPEKRE